MMIYSPEWGAAADALRAKLAETDPDAAELELPDLIHRVLAAAGKARGIRFPDRVPVRGGARTGSGLKPRKPPAA